jgi:hypothetical protein
MLVECNGFDFKSIESFFYVRIWHLVVENRFNFKNFIMLLRICIMLRYLVPSCEFYEFRNSEYNIKKFSTNFQYLYIYIILGLRCFEFIFLML